MEYDNVLRSGKSFFQHGMLNDRVYLMRININDIPYIMNQVNFIAEKNQYGKIYAKVPSYLRGRFEADNYETEALIPGFFNNRDDCCFMSKYLKKERKKEKNINKIQKIIKEINNDENLKKSITVSKAPFNIRKAGEDDTAKISEAFLNTMKTYPFPLFKYEYIQRMMEEGTVFYCAFDRKKIAGIASYKIDQKNRNVDFNNFLVPEEYRGKGITKSLLDTMEKDIENKGIFTMYSVTRANSVQMNRVLAGFKYKFAGTLINNTNIGGKIESMNVYYKKVTI